MEKSKTPQVFHRPSQFSSAIFSVAFAICFVALIHVEIELHVHRQMLQVLNQEREDSIELRKVVDGHEKTIDSVLKMLQSGSPTGNCILIKLSIVFSFSQFLTSIFSFKKNQKKKKTTFFFKEKCDCNFWLTKGNDKRKCLLPEVNSDSVHTC